MPLETAGLNTAADAVGAAYTWAALFNGDPTGAGTELSGGSPAYARQQLNFTGSAAGGVDSAAATVTFDIPSGATVAYVRLYTTVTGGTPGAYAALSASEGPYGAQGTYDLTAADLTFT